MNPHKTEVWSVVVLLVISIWIAVRAEASENLPLRKISNVNSSEKRLDSTINIRAFSVPAEVVTKKDSRKFR